MVNRVALGKLGDGTSYGLELSKPGFNVLTATAQEMAFSTRWGHAASVIIKGDLTGSATVDMTGAGTPVTIPFGFTMDYVPMAIVYFTTGDVGRRSDNYIFATIPATVYKAYNRPMYDVYKDKILIYNKNLDTSTNIRYVILRMPGG